MMAPYNESWKNKAWLAWFVLQIPLILRKFHTRPLVLAARRD